MFKLGLSQDSRMLCPAVFEKKKVPYVFQLMFNVNNVFFIKPLNTKLAHSINSPSLIACIFMFITPTQIITYLKAF